MVCCWESNHGPRVKVVSAYRWVQEQVTCGLALTLVMKYGTTVSFKLFTVLKSGLSLKSSALQCRHLATDSKASLFHRLQLGKEVGLHRISYPAPAEIRKNFHIWAGYGRRIWGRIWPSFDPSASLCNWAGIHCFTNSVICTSLFHHEHVDHTHILVSVCISLLVT